MSSVALEDVRAAAARIAGAVERTPLLESRTLSRLTGARVFLKFENLQFTASFKERGALNKLLTLSDSERARGVIAMSAGNHAQGVAYHAARLGVRAVIAANPFSRSDITTVPLGPGERYEIYRGETSDGGLTFTWQPVTANSAQDEGLLKRYGLFGPPATLFFGPDGVERKDYRVVGFKGPDEFLDHLQKAQR